MKAEIKELTRGCRLRGRPPSAEAAERIVEAATALFLGKGYGATTMQDVARRFGGSKQTIYARFPDKKALLEAVVTAFTERKLQTPRQLAAADGPAGSSVDSGPLHPAAAIPASSTAGGVRTRKACVG